jgi:hypothetical protein
MFSESSASLTMPNLSVGMRSILREFARSEEDGLSGRGDSAPTQLIQEEQGGHHACARSGGSRSRVQGDHD